MEMPPFFVFAVLCEDTGAYLFQALWAATQRLKKGTTFHVIFQRCGVSGGNMATWQGFMTALLKMWLNVTPMKALPKLYVCRPNENPPPFKQKQHTTSNFVASGQVWLHLNGRDVVQLSYSSSNCYHLALQLLPQRLTSSPFALLSRGERAEVLRFLPMMEVGNRCGVRCFHKSVQCFFPWSWKSWNLLKRSDFRDL